MTSRRMAKQLAWVLAASLVLVLGPAFAHAQSFAAWLVDLRRDALDAGIAPATLDRALSGLEPLPRVIELDRRQPERRFTFREYRRRVLSEQRIERGRMLFREHRPLLSEVGVTYGVQPRFIVALWGIESSYGAYRGDFPVVGALATLAYDGRRGRLFRNELINALRILDDGDVPVERLRGSWAGAMGQSQFMPSSYLSHAVDHDQDGRRDIWTSLPDVFASIANYLSKAGWDPRYTWGREVRVPESVGEDLVGLQVEKPLREWQALGVRRADGRDLPRADIDASLVRPDGPDGPAYLVYDNFRVLMAWNRSTYFALTVGELADRIRHG